MLQLTEPLTISPYQQEVHVREYEMQAGAFRKLNSLAVSRASQSGTLSKLYQNQLYLKSGKYIATAHMRETVTFNGLFAGQSVFPYGVTILHEKYKDVNFKKKTTYQTGDSAFLDISQKPQDIVEATIAKTKLRKANPWYMTKEDYLTAIGEEDSESLYQENPVVSRRYREVSAVVKTGGRIVLPVPYTAKQYDVYTKRNSRNEIVGIKIIFS